MTQSLERSTTRPFRWVTQTAPGTVKAQCNKIYGKAGVTGRAQLLSLFIEELMIDGLDTPSSSDPSN